MTLHEKPASHDVEQQPRLVASAVGLPVKALRHLAHPPYVNMEGSQSRHEFMAVLYGQDTWLGGAFFQTHKGPFTKETCTPQMWCVDDAEQSLGAAALFNRTDAVSVIAARVFRRLEGVMVQPHISPPPNGFPDPVGGVWTQAHMVNGESMCMDWDPVLVGSVGQGNFKLGGKGRLLMRVGSMRNKKGKKVGVWEYAHRLVMCLMDGIVPGHGMVCHTCDRGECCLAPIHILWGRAFDNNQIGDEKKECERLLRLAMSARMGARALAAAGVSDVTAKKAALDARVAAKAAKAAAAVHAAGGGRMTRMNRK